MKAFKTREHLETWLAKHHDTETELWVRIYKKDSGVQSVDWQDCVLASLTWGWIDGLKRSHDDDSFLQRLTPRRPKSVWSKKNCEHVATLIAEGRMQPSGLAHVEAAKKDGRWDNAYGGSKDMTLPPEFLAALKRNKPARTQWETLTRAQQYVVYFRLTNAKKPETRAKRLATFLEQLSRGEVPH